MIEGIDKLSGARIEVAAIEMALKEYVRLRRKELLFRLPGRLRLEENWRELREAELGE